MYDSNQLPERFLGKVEVSENCWLWKASTFPNGYGQYKSDGKNWKAHRFAYTTLVGPIPEELSVLHRCDVRTCVNPAHLWVGTHQDNMDDAAAKGRKGGEANPNSKLTETDIREIRDLCRSGLFSGPEIGKQYGVTGTMVGYIKRGNHWKGV
jgi:HNH endonuclease